MELKRDITQGLFLLKKKQRRHSPIIQDLTRLNKIAIPNNKFQMASGQRSHWLIEIPTILSSMCSPPLYDICQFFFKHILNTIMLWLSPGTHGHEHNKQELYPSEHRPEHHVEQLFALLRVDRVGVLVK